MKTVVVAVGTRIVKVRVPVTPTATRVRWARLRCRSVWLTIDGPRWSIVQCARWRGHRGGHEWGNNG